MPAWYFIIVIGSATQVGPFATAEQCNSAASTIEATFRAKLWINAQISPCVQGIVPVLVAVKPEVKK